MEHFFNDEINITNELSYYTTESSGATTSTFGSLGSTNSKFSGGVVVGNYIYCTPRAMRSVYKINTTNDSVSSFGTIDGTEQFCSSCYVPKNGKIYAGPLINAGNILIIDTTNDTISYKASGLSGTPSPLYLSSVYDGKDCVYFIPGVANRVMKLNIITNTVSFIGTDYGTGEVKWYYACLSPDGKNIYGSPSFRKSILKINLSNDSTSEIGNSFGNGSAVSYASMVIAKNGKIYLPPRQNVSSVIELDPSNDSYTTFGSTTAATDKYLGAALAANGKIYCVPFSTNRVGEIDPINKTIIGVGSSYTTTSKWLSGHLAPNGSIYCLPYANTITTFLKITPLGSGTFTNKMLESKWINKT